MITITYISKNTFSTQFIENVLMQPDMGLNGQVFFSEDTVAITNKLDPEVILMDSDEIPISNTMEIMTQLKETNPSVKILLLVSTVNNGNLFHFIEAGADSILEKHSTVTDEVIDTIRSVRNAHFAMPQKLIEELIERMVEMKDDNYDFFQKRLTSNGAVLSVKESEVAYYLKQNMRNRDIAKQIGVIEGTVKVHISNIYRKLNIKGRKNVVEYLNRIMSNKNDTERKLEFSSI
ncbi:response regulator transcription factor [Oceanobacillus rekensis]|uniref:response regulator transcription factor n=1 Tax=Oceanobacillus rekensis TaxID=937927 RepID=UPI001594BF9B|nr:response regulator transcription factor [Oceanobacillus rekensis]